MPSTKGKSDEQLAEMLQRGRKPGVPAELVEDADIGSGLSAAQHLVAEQNLQVIQQFGDGLPYERERVINEVRFYLSTAAEAMLEAGKRLVALKEIEGHGEFIHICEDRLGLSERTARQLVQAALKYLSPELEKHSSKLQQLGKAKLIELIAEDDDDLAALAEGGTVAGLELDDVARMSCRELRKALRESRENLSAKERVMADITAKNNQLATELAKKPKVIVVQPVEEAKQLRQEVVATAYEVEGTLQGTLRKAFSDLEKLAQQTGEDHRGFTAALVRNLEVTLMAIRSEFHLPELHPDQLPGWQSLLGLDDLAEG